MRLLRKTLALGAFFVAAIAISGCGSGVPGNAVADVAGNPITVQAFNHWMYLDAKNIASQSPGSPTVVPTDPPGYTNCIAALRSQVPSLKSTPTKTLRTDCASQFATLSTQVLNTLITDYWYQAEATKQHVTTSNAAVMKAFEAAKKQGFPTEAQFTTYLSQTGLTVQDILFEFRVTTLYNKLLAKHATKVTPAKVQAYYNAHLSQYTTPETLDLRIVLTNTSAQALAAKAALTKGMSWNVVAKKYSIDPTSKNNGGLLVNVTKGEEDQALDAAAFAAPAGKLLGPIHGQFGYYIFEVAKIKPSKTQPLSAATALIEQTLTTQLETKASNAVNAQARKDFLSRTTCRALYKVSNCSGYKKSAASSG